jgi:hypothetical protein
LRDRCSRVQQHLQSRKVQCMGKKDLG